MFLNTTGIRPVVIRSELERVWFKNWPETVSKWKNCCAMSYLIIRYIRSEPQFSWSSPHSKEDFSPPALSLSISSTCVFCFFAQSSAKISKITCLWWPSVSVTEQERESFCSRRIWGKCVVSVFNESFKMWSFLAVKTLFIVVLCGVFSRTGNPHQKRDISGVNSKRYWNCLHQAEEKIVFKQTPRGIYRRKQTLFLFYLFLFVSVCCSWVRIKMEREMDNPHLWSWALGSIRKNEIADTSSFAFKGASWGDSGI